MRVAIIGASALAVATAQNLIKAGHDVVMIESSKEKIESLSEQIDCGFIRGDGTKPAIQREADPKATEVLFCLTDVDQDNILASLVGRSLGFAKVVPKIEDPEYEHICLELGLDETIIPDTAMARTLVDMVTGQTMPDLSMIVRGEVRFFIFVADKDDAGKIDALALPDHTRVVCIYRDDDFLLPDADTELKANDEVVLITHSDKLKALRERWGQPRRTESEEKTVEDDAAKEG